MSTDTIEINATKAEADTSTAATATAATTATTATAAGVDDATAEAAAAATEAKGKHQKPAGKQRIMGTVTLAAAIAQAEAEAEEAARATQTWVVGDDNTTHSNAEEEAIDKTAVVMETRTTDPATATATTTASRPPKAYQKKRQKKPDWSSTQKGTKKARTTITTTMATHSNSTLTPLQQESPTTTVAATKDRPTSNTSTSVLPQFPITSIPTGKGATMHRKWNLHYTALQRYVKAYRGTYPKYPKAKGKKTIVQHGAVGSLYDWCNYQRQCYNTTSQHGPLTPQMIVALERLPNWFWKKKQPTTATIYTTSSTTMAMRRNFPRTTPSQNEAPTAAVVAKDRSHTASSQHHGFPYTEVVTNAILALKERTGSHYTAIQKWIIAHHPPNVIDPAKLTQKINLTLKKGVEKQRFLKIKMSYTVNPVWLKAQKKKVATQQEKSKAAFARGYPAWLKAQEKKKAAQEKKKTALGKKELALEKKEAVLEKKKAAFEKKMVALARGATPPGNKREPYKKIQEAQKEKEAIPRKKRGPYKKTQAQKEKEATPGGKQGPYKKKVTATAGTTRNSPQSGTPREKRGPYKKKGTTTTDTTSNSPQPGRPSKDTTTQQQQQQQQPQRHHDEDVEERAKLKQLVEQQASTIAAHAITIRNLERRLVTLEEAAAARTDSCANATIATNTTNEGTGEQKDETNGGTRSQNSSVVRHDLLLD